MNDETAAAPRTQAPRHPVILLHGIARTSRSMARLARALHTAGFAPVAIDYPSRQQPIAALAEILHPAIAAIARDAEELHFVGHSMGGLVARAYIAAHRPERLGRVVTIGTPHGGSEVADFLQRCPLYRRFYGPAGLEMTTAQAHDTPLPYPDYAIGCISGNRFLDPIAGLFIVERPNDGRVSTQSATPAGASDHVTVAASHSGLLLNKTAFAHTISFLTSGRFEAQTPTGSQS